MKKLIVISMGKATGEAIYKQLKRIVGEQVKIETILISEISKRDLNCDLVLFTSQTFVERGLKYFDSNTSYLVAKRVINHKNIEEIISISQGTKVLLVNDGESTAYEAIEQLIEIGLDHIKYYPYYPGCEEYPNLEIAITPGEAWLTPSCVNHIIDIGSRILDIRTVDEIISCLNIKGIFEKSLVTDYIRDIVEISRSIDQNRKAAIESEKLFETILNSVESGIAYVNSFEKIISINSKFESIIGKKRKDLIGKKITNILDIIDVFSKEKRTLITWIDGKETLVEVDEVNLEMNSGYLITMNYTDEISKLDHKIRRNHEKKINRKLYTFTDYLSVNTQVKELLRKAKKFSKTDATMLIQGENGTGKEIIAQGVHMNSFRRKNGFVPVNVAAIAPNLLESELFGYEEGSFTGAIKGGKAGLFEIANEGTIFIDEIGDAPLDLQVKLLRVLEERRIRRIGALEEIPINVRVIAATNKNLLKLIDEGQFREDLFFRLNILPLRTIPLRRRKEDIPYLIEYFIGIYFEKIKSKSLKEIFYKETIEFLENYCWRGNVRELVNLVEYLSFIYEGEKIGLADLPFYMTEEECGERIILDINELWVLEEIKSNNGVGRITLTQLAYNQDIDLGEGKIRAIIKKLKEKELIEHKKGIRGWVISQKGLESLGKYE